ncbi:hypothetical protein LCGC14_0711160 [marine sediment metagenome]|uniref:Uncharacterized protein n=1 Tax=marine sediment metagenome TaxID=412755 RepID=A0A0F9QJJ5_9ZZZZ
MTDKVEQQNGEYQPSKKEKNWLMGFGPSSQQRIHSSIQDPGLTMRLKSTRASIDLMADEPRLIQDVIMHDGVFVDQETGEKKQFVRTILVTPEGVACATTSDGVVQSLQELSQIYGCHRVTRTPRACDL